MLLLAPVFSMAQEEAQPQNEAESDNPDTDTNLAKEDSEPSNDASQDKSDDKQPLDAENQADLESSDEETLEGDGFPTHALKVDITGHVLFTDMTTRESYLEVVYQAKVEQDVIIGNSKQRVSDVNVEILTDVIGTLGGNDIYSCKLNVEFSNPSLGIVTQNFQPEDNDKNEPSDLESYLNIELDLDKKSFLEDWYSNCTYIDGLEFNTKGDKENYFYTLLQNVSPLLESLRIDNFDPTIEQSVPLEVLIEPYEDFDLNNELLFSGTGQITLSPL